jgi:hypothetical protein
VTSAEKARVDSEKIGQLLCTIFSHSDIPSGLSQFGEVIHNGNPKEPEWEVDGELFNVSYSFSRDEDGPNSFDVLIHSSNRAGSIFPNISDAEKWLGRLGLRIVRDQSSTGAERIRAVAFPHQGKRKIYYEWDTSIKVDEMRNLHVSWNRPEHASPNQRFCQAFR